MEFKIPVVRMVETAIDGWSVSCVAVFVCPGVDVLQSNASLRLYSICRCKLGPGQRNMFLTFELKGNHSSKSYSWRTYPSRVHRVEKL